MSWNYSCSLCFPLCFTSEMKHALSTSGSKSTFIFDSIIQHGGICHMSPVSGFLSMISEISATLEFRMSLFLTLVSRGRITNRSVLSKELEICIWAEMFAVVCKPWGPFKASMRMTTFLLLWMFVLLGQCKRPPKGRDMIPFRFSYCSIWVCMVSNTFPTK